MQLLGMGSVVQSKLSCFPEHGSYFSSYCLLTLSGCQELGVQYYSFPNNSKIVTKIILILSMKKQAQKGWVICLMSSSKEQVQMQRGLQDSKSCMLPTEAFLLLAYFYYFRVVLLTSNSSSLEEAKCSQAHSIMPSYSPQTMAPQPCKGRTLKM